MLSQDSFSPTSGESFHLIVDNSGSMSDASKAHIDGARELIGELPEGVLVTYSCFNRTVSIGQRLGRDEILRRLERPVCTGATSLYDAIVLAVAHEEERPMQQTTIVVVTDGTHPPRAVSTTPDAPSTESMLGRCGTSCFLGQARTRCNLPPRSESQCSAHSHLATSVRLTRIVPFPESCRIAGPAPTSSSPRFTVKNRWGRRSRRCHRFVVSTLAG